MILVLVAYGFDAGVRKRWRSFADRLGVPADRRIVVDNAHRGNQVGGREGRAGEYPGTNEQYEFSGYLEGLDHARRLDDQAHRVMLFNDTLFSHHWTLGWGRIASSQSRQPGIWGDGRNDTIPSTGRRLRFLASWHFDLVGSAAIECFRNAVSEVVDRFDEPSGDSAYESYIERYLDGSLWHGYSDPGGLDSPADKQRKLACIRAEHRLSQHKVMAMKIRSYEGPMYRSVHSVDRMLSARRRAGSLRSSGARRVSPASDRLR